MNQARQTRRRSYSSSPISRKRGTRRNVAKYDYLLLRAPNRLKKTTARLRSFYSTAFKIWRQKINENKAAVNAERLHHVSLSACDDSVLYIYIYIYIYGLFQFPRFCKTAQRLIFLQHPTQFIIHCHPNTRQYTRIISASGSQSFFYTGRMTSACAKHLKNEFHMRETLEKLLPHARNTWGITSTYAKHLKNDVYMGEILKE